MSTLLRAKIAPASGGTSASRRRTPTRDGSAGSEESLVLLHRDAGYSSLRVYMRGRDADERCRELRAHPRRPPVPALPALLAHLRQGGLTLTTLQMSYQSSMRAPAAKLLEAAAWLSKRKLAELPAKVMVQ